MTTFWTLIWSLIVVTFPHEKDWGVLFMKKILGILALGLLLPNYLFAHHPGNNPTEIWLLCHNIMHFIGDITSLGYAGANVFVFLILQPGLIILFMTLWLIERFK